MGLINKPNEIVRCLICRNHLSEGKCWESNMDKIRYTHLSCRFRMLEVIKKQIWYKSAKPEYKDLVEKEIKRLRNYNKLMILERLE